MDIHSESPASCLSECQHSHQTHQPLAKFLLWATQRDGDQSVGLSRMLDFFRGAHPESEVWLGSSSLLFNFCPKISPLQPFSLQILNRILGRGPSVHHSKTSPLKNNVIYQSYEHTDETPFVLICINRGSISIALFFQIKSVWGALCTHPRN